MTSREYAAICGFEAKKYAATCETTSHEYAPACAFAVDEFAAVCSVTNSVFQHPADFTTRIQSEELMLSTIGIGRKQHDVIGLKKLRIYHHKNTYGAFDIVHA